VVVQQASRHESDVLIRRIDRRLATLRTAANVDVARAERIGEVLRRLVADTALASAADRARVRAAVHYFLVRRADDARVVNRIVRDLGREDLANEVDGLACGMR
jgi:hypothetical protein